MGGASWRETDEMILSWKTVVSTTCVAVVCGTAILWRIHKNKATERKLTEAARISRAGAEQGDAPAQYSLGDMYREGLGVPQDYAEAIRWYRKAADQGSAIAQYSLGNMHREGLGVPHDYAEAIRWYRKAADKGYIMAENALGYIYDRGQGVPQDYAEAVRWCRKAADQGDAMAQCYLGFSYAQGHGVPQDYAEAVRWYRKAADQGYANAQYGLGFIYDKGQGVPRDHAEAVRWYRKAADQGDTKARSALGPMYCIGREIPSWTSIVAILLASAILVVPQRRWGRATWLPWALCSATCAALLAHQLLLSETSLAVLAQGSLGPLWKGFGRDLLIALLGSGSAVCALAAVRGLVRRSKRPGEKHLASRMLTGIR